MFLCLAKITLQHSNKDLPPAFSPLPFFPSLPPTFGRPSTRFLLQDCQQRQTSTLLIRIRTNQSIPCQCYQVQGNGEFFAEAMAYQYQLPMMAPPNGMFIYPNLATMKPDDLLATFTQAVPTVHGLYAAQTAQALQLIRTAQAVQAMHDMQTFQAQATHQVIQATQAVQAAHAVQAAQINHASPVGQAFPGSHPVAIQDGAGVSNHVNTVVQNNGGGETSTVTSPQVGIAAQGIIGGVVNKRPLNSFIAYRSECHNTAFSSVWLIYDRLLCWCLC